jgi:hypothetical protein
LDQNRLGQNSEFSSRADGSSRDKRDDRRKVVIDLLVAENGILIVH